MKLRIFALIFALSMLFTLSACNFVRVEDPVSQDKSDPEAPLEIRVFTLNGTTGFGMAKMMEDADNGEFANENYVFEVKSDATEILAALTSGTVDIAALPTNAAANVYNKTQGGVKILAINTLGCLYLVNGTETTISSVSELQGKTVYAPAQNPTFILTYLCQQYGLEVITDGDPIGNQVLIDSTSYSAPAALRDAVASGAVELAVLPEPMVTIAVSSAAKASITLKVDLDLTAAWDTLDNKANTLVQGCVVVRTEFLEAHPNAINNFLSAYKDSIAYLDETAQLIQEHEIFANAGVAKKAIPKCNVKYIDGKDMKNAVSTYLEILNGINSQSIGGAIPGEDFYYHANN